MKDKSIKKVKSKSIYGVQRKSHKKFIVSLIVILVVLIALVMGYFIIKDMKQEQILREEVQYLSNLDITKDRYNVKIKTTGDYAVVEGAIKDYLDEYAVTLQDVLVILSDEKLASVLSASNYKDDGPEFKNTKEYITNTRATFNEKLNKLTEMTSEEAIMNQIESKKLDDYYVNLYNEFMLRGVAAEDLKNSKDDLSASTDKINNLLDVEESVIDLLIANKGKWSIENDKIVFQETATLNKYNELIGGLK